MIGFPPMPYPVIRIYPKLSRGAVGGVVATTSKSLLLRCVSRSGISAPPPVIGRWVAGCPTPAITLISHFPTRMNTRPKIITTLRPPQHLLELADRARGGTGKSRAHVIREALDAYRPLPRSAESPDPVRSLYVRLNSRLAITPVGFCCPADRLVRYQKKAIAAGAGSLNGLVSLALDAYLNAQPSS